MIKENIIRINSELDEICARCNRKRENVNLIAVSKIKPIDKIKEAYDIGVRDFGENRVKELLEKKKELPEDIRWHLIGHLQSNKVKQVIANTFLIHSIDSINISDVIDYEAKKQNIVVNGLLEINVAKEESKFGFIYEDLLKKIERFGFYKNLKILGLMTVAPFVENGEENREVFSKLRQFSVDIESKNVDNVSIKYLSMGMSGDYKVAVEEGANFIRVGTDIFGSR